MCVCVSVCLVVLVSGDARAGSARQRSEATLEIDSIVLLSVLY